MKEFQPTFLAIFILGACASASSSPNRAPSQNLPPAQNRSSCIQLLQSDPSQLAAVSKNLEKFQLSTTEMQMVFRNVHVWEREPGFLPIEPVAGLYFRMMRLTGEGLAKVLNEGLRTDKVSSESGKKIHVADKLEGIIKFGFEYGYEDAPMGPYIPFLFMLDVEGLRFEPTGHGKMIVEDIPKSRILQVYLFSKFTHHFVSLAEAIK